MAEKFVILYVMKRSSLRNLSGMHPMWCERCFLRLNTFFYSSRLLVGIRAYSNQVKTLSQEKDYHEGHIADFIADALSRFVIGLRFQCRSQRFEVSVRKLLAVVTRSRCQ